jgi:hypothetical protein
MRGRGRTWLGYLIYALTLYIGAILFFAAPVLGGYTGSITRAVLSPNEELASIAGSSYWTGCEVPPGEDPWPESDEELPPPGSTVWDTRLCRFRPFVSIGPGTSEADCWLPARRYPNALGAGVLLAWAGTESWKPETQAFDLTSASLAAEGRLVCLGAQEEGAAKCHIGELDVVCMLSVPEFIVLASETLEVTPEQPSPPTQEQSPLLVGRLSGTTEPPAAAEQILPLKRPIRQRCRKRRQITSPRRKEACLKKGRQIGVSRQRGVSKP